MLSGSIGLLPSASTGGITGIYEPIHGSAPDIAGESLANPIATIASAAMMLKYEFGEIELANKIDNAIKRALNEGYVTKDLADFGNKKLCSTGELGTLIAEFVKE